jgi:hypothetical protein
MLVLTAQNGSNDSRFSKDKNGLTIILSERLKGLKRSIDWDRQFFLGRLRIDSDSDLSALGL